jgi:hypothetical protein
VALVAKSTSLAPGDLAPPFMFARVSSPAGGVAAYVRAQQQIRAAAANVSWPLSMDSGTVVDRQCDRAQMVAGPVPCIGTSRPIPPRSGCAHLASCRSRTGGWRRALLRWCDRRGCGARASRDRDLVFKLTGEDTRGALDSFVCEVAPHEWPRGADPPCPDPAIRRLSANPRAANRPRRCTPVRLRSSPLGLDEPARQPRFGQIARSPCAQRCRTAQCQEVALGACATVCDGITTTGRSACCTTA